VLACFLGRVCFLRWVSHFRKYGLVGNAAGDLALIAGTYREDYANNYTYELVASYRPAGGMWSAMARRTMPDFVGALQGAMDNNGSVRLIYSAGGSWLATYDRTHGIGTPQSVPVAGYAAFGAGDQIVVVGTNQSGLVAASSQPGGGWGSLVTLNPTPAQASISYDVHVVSNARGEAAVLWQWNSDNTDYRTSIKLLR
jgi:hypothetical protein